jgi:4-hydroxy-tetrahydrodipicolinate synthase
LDILQIGGIGCISATTNVTSRVAGEVFRAWKNQDYDLAQNLQNQLTELRLTIQQCPFVPGVRQIMKDFTGQEDWLNMRPPNVPLTEGEARKLLKALEALNFTAESVAGFGGA